MTIVNSKDVTNTGKEQTAMDIRSSLDGLKSILNVSQSSSAAATQSSGSAATTNNNAWNMDEASLSNVGSAFSSASASDGVRMDKVAAIQQALSSGTYSVSATAVASKLVDSMLGTSAVS